MEASWVWRTVDTGGWDKTSYEYRLHFDSPTAMALPGNGSPEPRHEYRYNSRGLKTAEDPGKPYAISYAYDELDRVKGVTYSDPATSMSSKLFYDAGGRVTRANLYRRGTLLNKTTAAYNLRGWLTSETWTVDGASYSLGYAYNDAGDRIEMTYPGGTAFSFEYDSQGRLVRIPGYFEQEGQPAQKGFAYDANGFLTNATAASGVSSAYAADAHGRLKTISVARQQPAESILRLDYSYTPQGNVSCISGASGGPPFELRYGYDWANRLTSAQVLKPSGISTVGYQYDGAGNRTSETWSGSGAVQYRYDPGNYLKTRGAANYAWGPYGQLISKTEGAVTTQYGYNAQRLMNAVKVDGAATANYEYDALGRRVKAVEGGTTIVTLHSGNDIVYEARKTLKQTQQGSIGAMAIGDPGIPPGERIEPVPDPGDPPPPPPWLPPPPPPPPPPAPEYDVTVTCYLALNGKYLAKIVRENSDPAQTYFLHADMVGSIRAITDSAGEVVARFEYEPFGLLAMSTGSMAAGAHRFTGKPEDEATELYYFGARYYDPEVGRFISRDPAKDGLNWYVYCLNSPLRYIDPDGRWTLAAGGNAVAAFLLKVGLTGQVVIDGHGNVGILVAADAGGGTPNIGAAGAFTCTGADTIFDLRGIGCAAGGSAGPLGLEVTRSDQCIGVTVTWGVSALPAEGHGTIGGCLVLGVTGWVGRFIEDRIVPWMFRQMQRLPDPVKRIIVDELGIPADACGGMSSGTPDYRKPAGNAPSRVTYCVV